MKIDGPTIQLRSGRYVEPLNLDPSDVTIEDVAHSLSNQCRFSGHTSSFYSVAQHSVLVAGSCASTGCDVETILWALLHDASEAYLVDLPRPIKHAPGIGSFYRKAEVNAMNAVVVAFDLRGFEMPPEVHAADVAVLAAERRDLMPKGDETWAVLDGVRPYPSVRPIVPWSPESARALFLRQYASLNSRRQPLAA